MRHFLFILFFISIPCFAVKEYYSISRSIRALGMGNAFYSLSDDENALFYNPAGLGVYYAGGQYSLLDIIGQASGETVSSISTLSDAFKVQGIGDFVGRLSSLQGEPSYIGNRVLSVYVRKGFAVGLLVADIKANSAFLGREFASEMDITALSDSGLFLGKSFTFGKHFHLGLNTKFLYRGGGRKFMTVEDFATSSGIGFDELGGFGGGIDFDLGMIWEIPKAPFGETMGLSFTLSNLIATQFPLFRIRSGPPALCRMASFGSYFIFNGGKVFEKMIGRVEVAEIGLGGQSDPHLGARTGSFWKHLNFGLEVPVKGWLFLRTGFYQGAVTAGLGIALSFMKLDFATYGEELADGVGRLSSRRYVLRLAFGYASSPRHSYTRRRSR